jgi:hypothetical protein
MNRIVYPETRPEYDACFGSEEACRKYIQQLRWPEGFRCVACNFHLAWHTARGQLRCSRCQKQISLTAGTILEGTRKPLRQWMEAIWYVTGRKSGVSALGLCRELNLGSYQTAWTWLHKLRHAMVTPEHKLRGFVDAERVEFSGLIDPTVKRLGKPGSSTVLGIAVEAITEPGKEGIGQIHLQRLSSWSPADYVCFLRRSCAIDTGIRTAPDEVYRSIPDIATNPECVRHVPAGESLPRVHQIAVQLRRWLGKIYCNSVNACYIDYYLDEFSFRVNNRRDSTRGRLFHTLLCQTLRCPPGKTTAVRPAPAMEARTAKAG